MTIRKVALAGSGLLLACFLGNSQNPPAHPKDQHQDQEEIKLIASLNGTELYKAYCAVCHGKVAKGDGPMAFVLKTPPTDLTLIAARNGGKFPLAHVQQIISGESQVSGHGVREMPVWGPIFSQVAWDQDFGRVRVYNLAKYLEQLQEK